MQSPFIYGKITSEPAFTDRIDETAKLIANFESGINTIIISPRRWGKSSLVKHAADKIAGQNPANKVIQIDLFQIRSEEEFYNHYAQVVIKATSDKLDDWINTAKSLLGKFVPKISIGIDPQTEFQISLDVKSQPQSAIDILNLPQKIAEEKGLKVLVCLDEFQNITFFDSPTQFQQILRSAGQHHQQVVYVLYGSKRTMLYDLFEHRSKPLYKFGELLPLQLIDARHWIPFLIERFAQGKKKITEANAAEIVELTCGHPYYTQQLSHFIWLRTPGTVTKPIIADALDEILTTQSIFFEREVEQFSNTQLRFLSAVARGYTNGLSSVDRMMEFKLGTSANVTKNKRRLIDLEILYQQNGNLGFIDPMFDLWFRKRFLKLPD